MVNFFQTVRRVPMDQDAKAHRQTVPHSHFMPTHPRCLVPAKLSWFQGRILRIDIWCGEKKDAANIFLLDPVMLNHLDQ